MTAKTTTTKIVARKDVEKSDKSKKVDHYNLVQNKTNPFVVGKIYITKDTIGVGENVLVALTEE